MEPLYKVTIASLYGEKEIAVYHADATHFDEPIDILTISAFHNDYEPVPRTLIRALFTNCGINVEELAGKPCIDLRNTNHVWLSDEIKPVMEDKREVSRIGRIGCVELMPYTDRERSCYEHEEMILKGIKSYFQMLDLAATSGIAMETVAVPFLGAGSQQIKQELVKIPLIHECMECLKRNSAIKRIIFIEMSPAKAFSLASTLEKSYAVKSESYLYENDAKGKNAATAESYTPGKPPAAPGEKKAFISYSTKDKTAADLLCKKLEEAGVSVWYAPRNIVKDDYASSIVGAIMDASCFITIISKNSIDSQHVLNEIDVAFKRVKDGKSMIPVRLDDVELIPAFEYYLSRFQWMDVSMPPQEEKIDEIIGRIIC